MQDDEEMLLSIPRSHASRVGEARVGQETGSGFVAVRARRRVAGRRVVSQAWEGDGEHVVVLQSEESRLRREASD